MFKPLLDAVLKTNKLSTYREERLIKAQLIKRPGFAFVHPTKNKLYAMAEDHMLVFIPTDVIFKEMTDAETNDYLCRTLKNLT